MPAHATTWHPEGPGLVGVIIFVACTSMPILGGLGASPPTPGNFEFATSEAASGDSSSHTHFGLLLYNKLLAISIAYNYGNSQGGGRIPWFPPLNKSL
jgi:hypothetical protein